MIDLIISLDPQKVGAVGVQYLSISDHSLVYTVRQSRPRKKPPQIIITRNYSRCNEKDFLKELETTPLHIIEALDDPDLAWTCWKIMVLDACNAHAPLSTRKVRGEHYPGMNDDIIRRMRQSDFFHFTK